MPDSSADHPALKTSLPSAHAASSSALAPTPQLSQQQKEAYLRKPGTEPRHFAIALHHAHQIQAQKDTETLILDRILDLVGFPRSSPAADPAAPAPDDVAAFKSALLPFQPADYDNLIKERNIEGLCGYALCPREHRKDESSAATGYRIVWGPPGSGPAGRGRDMNIVPREKLEMWCSGECAERAMYIRVQLAEEPVWERQADDARAKDILLLEESRAAKLARKEEGKEAAAGSGDLASGVADDLKRLDLRDSDPRSNALALERGDLRPSQPGRVDVHVREKENVHRGSVRSPEIRQEDCGGGSIEGYVPKERRDARDVSDDEKEDLLDQF
ncbi:DUF408 domain protein [Aspergillus sp. HF37]|nr:DUF408 domain protein [Aspergillus sp. HF37]